MCAGRIFFKNVCLTFGMGGAVVRGERCYVSVCLFYACFFPYRCYW